MALLELHGGLDPSREFPPHEPPADAPGYREKYWACGYDGVAGVGFSIWLETTAADYSVWHESLHLVLPDGRILLSCTETPRFTPDGPGGQRGAGICEVPFERWIYRVRSAMEAFTATQLTLRTDERALHQPGEATTDVELDLTLVSTAPAWNLSVASTTKAGEAAFATQYRQLFRASGEARVQGSPSVRFDATGFRAHSSGPYHGSSFGGHAMISVQFPSGRGAGFLRHVRPDGSATVSQAFVVEAGAVVSAQVVDAPKRLPRISPGGEHFTVRLRTDAQEYVIEVDVVVNVSSVRPNYFVDTARTDEDLAIVSRQADGLANAISYGRFSMDGEVGFGVIERSSRLSLLES